MDLSREPEENQNLKKIKTTKGYGETRCVICKNGSKNLRRILWMKVFQNTWTHPSSLLVNQLQNREGKWHRAKHSFYTRFPKDRHCEVCLRKMTRAPFRRRTGEAPLRAEKFGDLITAHHKVLNEEGGSRNNHRYAVVVQDLGTQWIQPYPCATIISQATEKSLRKFLGSSEVIFSDNPLEVGKCCEDLSWNHCTSTPHRSGTSAVQLQSSLDERWSTGSMECYCYLRNVQDLLADGESAYERRFREPLKGPIIPCVAMVPVKAPRIWQESFTWNIPRMCIDRGGESSSP